MECADDRRPVPLPLGDPTGQRKACPVFHLPPFKGSWALCAEGLAHPHTGDIRPITFDPTVIDGRDDIVLAHLNHRLVQICLRLLRAEIWSQGSHKKLHRITARLAPDDALTTPAVIAHGRLVVLGGDNQRLHEEVILAGGVLREGRFARMASIVVVEIKRPMRNDASAGEKDDPVEQAIGYLNRIRNGEVLTPQGRSIPQSDSIPGFCYVLADITPKLRDRCLIHHDLKWTHDQLGFFGYKQNCNAFIAVISFDQLVNSAKQRNRAFFDKLGLPTT